MGPAAAGHHGRGRQGGAGRGSPRIRDDLADEGSLIGRNRVQRLMREEGIFGVHRRKLRCLTKRDASDPVARNELAGDFSVDAPNKAWVADITYIETTQGWLYLAVVIDLFSRSVVYSQNPVELIRSF